MSEIEEKEKFYAEVYSIVRQIPYGKVISYGQLARLAGRPNNARMMGNILKYAPQDAGIPFHRVVNSQGRIAPNCPEHKKLLEAEGVTFRNGECVKIKKHVWDIFQ